MNTGAERQMSQDRKLLGGVAAVHVHRGIGFRETEPLSLLDGLRIVGTGLLHLRKDEVAGSVQDTAERCHLVGRQALTDVGDDGYPARD